MTASEVIQKVRRSLQKTAGFCDTVRVESMTTVSTSTQQQKAKE